MEESQSASNDNDNEEAELRRKVEISFRAGFEEGLGQKIKKKRRN